MSMDDKELQRCLSFHRAPKHVTIPGRRHWEPMGLEMVQPVLTKQAGVESLSTESYKGSGPKAGKASGHSAVRAKQASLGAGGSTTHRAAL